MRFRNIACALALASVACWASAATTKKKSRTKKTPPPVKAERAPLPPTRPNTEVALPAPLKQIAVGGSGKYLFAFLPTLKQVAVIDVAAKKIVKLVPTEDTDSLVAAGETKFVVLQRGKGIISRYDLASCERELTVGAKAYNSLAMGASSEGPVLGGLENFELINLTSLKPTGEGAQRHIAHLDHLAASTTGTVFVCGEQRESASDLVFLQVADGKLSSQRVRARASVAIPAADGQIVYTSLGRFGLKGKLLDNNKNSRSAEVLLPAATEPFLSLVLARKNRRRSRIEAIGAEHSQSKRRGRAAGRRRFDAARHFVWQHCCSAGRPPLGPAAVSASGDRRFSQRATHLGSAGDSAFQHSRRIGGEGQ